ncbi:uncharacterized protein [Henckelia pumila]|uniref:uncharacterized protein n=1 Tax=Henckelia pumila TaxID=405737 RepID=UPI003C6E837F
MKQQDQETLREFIQCFNGAALEVPTATSDILISSFTQGLKGGEFFKSLVKIPPSSYDDLLARAENYVNLEEAQRHRRDEKRQGGSNVEWVDKGGMKRGMGEREDDRARGKGQFSPYVPLAQNRDKVMEVEEERRNQGICKRLMKCDSYDFKRCHQGDSGRARKAHGRRMENFEISKELNLLQDPIISFGPEDLRGVAVSHNDALVVTVTIANYDVTRIFVDSGSSLNVLFKGMMDQMKIEGFELEPISTPLYGFTGHVIRSMGQIDLLMSMGIDPKKVTKMVSFTVVDAPSSYHGILGRPAMKDFKAITSTYHQKLKFPGGREVGVLRGDQMVAL